MDDRAYWTKRLEEAERELEAAKGRTALNAASKKLQMARRELKQLDEATGSKSKTNRGRRRA
jgi:hypothetical protein